MSAIPTTPKGRLTWAHLVRSGRTVFARDGYVNARMGDVATEAKASMGGLYRYFQNKEDLFAQVIEDLHEQLYEASNSHGHSFRNDPYNSLLSANLGYLTVYEENRDVIRAFMQAAHVETRFQDIWWQMRERHIDRFTEALEKVHNITEVDGVPARTVAETLSCMTEQSAYVWFAQEELHGGKITAEEAAKALTISWYTAIFGGK